MKNDSPGWLLMFGVGGLCGVMLTVICCIQWKLLPGEGPVKMAYHELVAILLTGIGVILAALALFIGALAVWGYAQFQSMTRSASHQHIDDLLKDGPLKQEVAALIEKNVTSQLKAEESPLRKILEERVDVLIQSNAEERVKENDASQSRSDGKAEM